MVVVSVENFDCECSAGAQVSSVGRPNGQGVGIFRLAVKRWDFRRYVCGGDQARGCADVKLFDSNACKAERDGAVWAGSIGV